MTDRPAPARPRRSPASRDPYGIGPVSGYIGPVLAVVALIVVAAVTWTLLNGQIPGVSGKPGPGGNNPNGGLQPTEAPSNVVIVDPGVTFPGSIVYAKAGNIWRQTGTNVVQLTTGGTDSMPTWSADGQWIYYIRITPGAGKFPSGGYQARTWYDLETPSLLRMKPDGSGTQRLLTGRYVQGNSTWFFWLRQPVPSPDGNTVAVVSDGPNPLQSDVVLHSFNIASKTLTSLHLPEELALGQQDPAWRPDGRYLLYVKNGRDGTRGAPTIYRYDPTSKKTAVVSGPGYMAPAYSPDGRWIAATRTDAFGTDIALLDATGKEVLRVTNDAHSFSPVWSPAGDAVAFLHLTGTIVDLQMITLDASSGSWVAGKKVDLTTVSGLDGASRPSWYAAPSELPPPSTAPGGGSGPSASPDTGSGAAGSPGSTAP